VKSRLYLAEVVHARFTPAVHRFKYPVFIFGFRLDELKELDARVRFFGYNRPALVSLHDRDYLRGEGSIRERLLSVLRGRGIREDVQPVELLTVPRMFGHVFNPVSFHLCRNAGGYLRCIVAEVNNTFGEKHLYVLERPAGAPDTFPVEFRHPKQFHVSPFNDMRGEYQFSFSELGENIRIVITLVRDGKKVMTAVLRGHAVELNTRNLLSNVLRHPFRIVAAIPRIMREASVLHFRKGLRVFPKPNPSHPMSMVKTRPTAIQRICMKAVTALLRGLRRGHLSLRLPDSSHLRFGEAESPDSHELTVWNYAFFTRVAFSGDVGLGESYVAAEWDAKDLPGLLRLMVNNLEALGSDPSPASIIGRTSNYVRHALRSNTRSGSRRNIRDHYDLGNDFYSLWLDPETMFYSCAFFEDPGQPLHEAQKAKALRLISAAGIAPDHHVLEIGCGWGGFAIEAVRATGCRVTGITISQAQLRLARERVAAAGLSDRITLLLKDYRDITGAFDRIVSIEMLEAVGHSMFPAFFKRCSAALAPGGKIALQVITIPDARYDLYRRNPDWIQKHIFPGGLLPSRQVLFGAMEAAGIAVEKEENIGLHYVTTLRAWRERFNRQSERLRELGFDDAFQRKWNYYLSYCEAGFAERYIDDWQFVAAPRSAPSPG